MDYHHAETLVEKLVEALKSLGVAIFLGSIILGAAIYFG
jgi:hypothetical protein